MKKKGVFSVPPSTGYRRHKGPFFSRNLTILRGFSQKPDYCIYGEGKTRVGGVVMAQRNFLAFAP